MNEVLVRTPLELKPIQTPNSLQSIAMSHRNSLVSKGGDGNAKNLISLSSTDEADNAPSTASTTGNSMSNYAPYLTSTNQCTTVSPINTKPDLLNLIDNLIVEQPHTSDGLAVGGGGGSSRDMLSTPPNLNFDSFLELDELLTPDEFPSLNLIEGGLTNINYDFDISDATASASDDPKSNNSLDEFDPLLNADRNSGKCSPIEMDATATNLMDGGDSPNDTLLPSPLKPTVPAYKGFSAFDIPSISCQTGDFGSSVPETDGGGQAVDKQTINK